MKRLRFKSAWSSVVCTLAAAAVVGIIGVCYPATAEPLALPNHSFESPVTSSLSTSTVFDWTRFRNPDRSSYGPPNCWVPWHVVRPGGNRRVGL